MLYKVNNGAVTLGNKTILEDINFEVKNREHVALVGRNGCGKTTLLKALNGNVEFERGLAVEELVITKLGISNIGYIKQDAIMDEEITMLDEILKAYGDILQVEENLKNLEEELSFNYNDKLLNKYQDLYLYFQTLGVIIIKKNMKMLLKFLVLLMVIS